MAGEHSLLGGAVLFAVTFGLYMATRSHSLDDWDSINFARAIDTFNVAAQQPHPPGYPAYVFLSRLVNLIANDPQIALTSLSAICGAVCVLAFYALACDLGIGWAALPLATMPLFWLNSEMALTDVPGVTFAVISVWLLNRSLAFSTAECWWQGRTASFIAGCAVAGVDAGVRPQDAVVPAAVLACYVLPTLWRERADCPGLRRDVALGGTALLVTCMLWAVPLYRNLTQDSTTFEPYKVQIQYIKDWDALWSDPQGPYADEAATPIQERVKLRVAAFGSVFSSYFGGPQEGGIVASAGLAGALGCLTLLGRKSKGNRLAVVWLTSYGVVLLAVMQPTDPRKILPALPPMLLLLAGAAAAGNSKTWRNVVSIACLALTGVFAAKALPLVRTLDRTPTPPEQVSDFIAQWYSPDDTIVLAATALNHIRYYIPQFTSFSVIDMDDDGLLTQLAQRPVKYIVVVDQDGPDIPAQYRQSGIWEFGRDSRVLPKGSYTALTEYELSTVRPSAATDG